MDLTLAHVRGYRCDASPSSPPLLHLSTTACGRRIVAGPAGLARGVLLSPLSAAAFAAVPLDPVSRCAFCCSPGDLSRCTSCSRVRYCGRACQAADWAAHHKHECASLKRLDAGRELPAVVRLASRVLRAQGASQVGGETALLASSDGALNAARAAALSGAAGALALVTNRGAHSEEQLLEYATMGVGLSLLGGAGEGGHTPSSVLDTFARLRCAAFSTCDGEQAPFGLALFPLGGTLNHSCTPNVFALFKHDASGGGGGGVWQEVRTLAPIAAGEELTLGYTDVGVPTHVRRKALSEGHLFLCSCLRCKAYADVEASLARAADGHAIAALGPLLLRVMGPDDGTGAGALVPPPWRVLAAHSPEDVRMQSVRCGGTRGDGSGACAGHCLAVVINVPKAQLPAAATAAVAVASSGRHGAAVGKQGRVGSPSTPADDAPPPPSVYAHPCSSCSAPLSLAAAHALVDATASAAIAAALFARGDSASALAVGVAALPRARAALAPTHHTLAALAGGVAHAAVACGEWATAEAANAVAVPAFDACYPRGHPLAALQHAQLGRLLHLSGDARGASEHLRAALAALSVSHGSAHALVESLAETCAQAVAEAERF